MLATLITMLIFLLFFIYDQLLAMVYSNFAEEEKQKFCQLSQHKIEGLSRAYSVLETFNGIESEEFLRFMQYYKPRTRMIICKVKLFNC